nr:EOG090X0A11 [Eulimnadia texana]
MPLVVVTGFPSSGKSRRSQELTKYFQNLNKNVTVICENEVVKSKNEVFSDSRKEKDVRGHLKTEVQRLLNKEDVLILDAGNYIKGYRYELFCVSKATKTPQCTIHCDTNAETCWQWNISREPVDQYNRETLDALVMRYEAPDSRNRWDSPLFTVQASDETLPLESINAALFERKAPPPNHSTQSLPLSSTNFLYELDRVTQDIVNRVMEAQKMGGIGNEIKIPDSNEKLILKRLYPLSELARIRRQFISYTKSRPLENIQLLASMFVQYLTSNLL